mmetsp:Transcript_34628/g.62797  ORF Transcript_34628/g.62797 Transcript_34628/m.62797 type:complete len:104 (-) Transcript_34628:241-552(-)|eukprot:CAMPEP_0197627490 /NCGR_PEP_ID=MMETSP1338-20131121/6094_1 /TAXON_ID=43686 ORGANISM="Pelagodinium beii, Strain RCC1491" /NCGR_SAMPLE_ID=MMETSP1338 /ASSEMBLY_ACC=CAM_ASM_000754 /LENGTH=103 /DNA_ID=CAMNT_0043198227 /DNA_START=27 /DNA_END=338 /DNA_ORIENTATION=-
MPASVAASHVSSKRASVVSSTASNKEPAPIHMAPKRDRVTGKCTCGKNDDKKGCKCVQVVLKSYNDEVYRALESRGGAIWERLQKEKENREHNDGGGNDGGGE